MSILSIDLGIDAARCLLVIKPGEIKNFEIPLGFATIPNINRKYLLDYIVSEVEELSSIKIWGEMPILIAGENIRALRGIREVNVYTLYEVLKSFEYPVLDIERDVLFFLDKMFFPIIDPNRIRKWLTFNESKVSLKNRLENLKIYSQIIPQYGRDFSISTAILREKILNSLKLVSWDASEVKKPIVVSGSFISKVYDPGNIFLSIIDSLVFSGKLEILFDRDHVLANAAAISFYDNKLYKSIYSQLNFIALGAVIAVSEDITAEIDLGLDKKQKLDIPKNSLYSIPVDKNSLVKVKIHSEKMDPFNYEVFGGEVGVVFDTREKPLNLDVPVRSRIKLLDKWRKSLGMEHFA